MSVAKTRLYEAMKADSRARAAYDKLGNRRLAVTDNHRLVHIMDSVGTHGNVVVKPITGNAYPIHNSRLTLVPNSNLMVSELRFT